MTWAESLPSRVGFCACNVVILGSTRSRLHGWGYLVPCHAKPRQCRGLSLSGPQWDTEACADVIGGEFCKRTGYTAVDSMEDSCEGGAGRQPLWNRGAGQAAWRGPLGGADLSGGRTSPLWPMDGEGAGQVRTQPLPTLGPWEHLFVPSGGWTAVVTEDLKQTHTVHLRSFRSVLGQTP